MKSSQIMEQPMAGRASMAVLAGYRLYSYEVFTKAISKQNGALNGKDSSQIELCDWVRFFILQTSLIRSCLITLPPVHTHHLLRCMDVFKWIGSVAVAS